MRFDALLFDFDGVLLESEYAGNAQLADWLTKSGHPTSVEQAMDAFMGLAGLDFIGAIERWIGRAVPDDFHAARAEEDARAIRDPSGPRLAVAAGPCPRGSARLDFRIGRSERGLRR